MEWIDGLTRQPKLATAQRAQLPTLLAKGAEAYGFIGDVWTTARVARRRFFVPR